MAPLRELLYNHEIALIMVLVFLIHVAVGNYKLALVGIPYCWGIWASSASISRWFHDTSPAFLYFWVYMLMPFLPSWARGSLHPLALANADMFLFQGNLPSEWIASFSSLPSDILASIAYFMFHVSPFIWVTVYTVFERQRLRAFFTGLSIVSFAAVIFQLIYPTAPPWHRAGVSNIGELVRVDEWLGFPFCKMFFENNAILYGSFPSIHCAWAAYDGFHMWELGHRYWWARWSAVVYVLWIVWAVLYLRHHYVVDAVAGVVLALCVEYGMHWWEHRKKTKTE